MTIRLDHIGIAVNDLNQAEKFWNLLGISANQPDEEVTDQGVITRFMPISKEMSTPASIELLEPTGENTPVGKFIAKRGVGIQQICFEVSNLNDLIKKLIMNGINMIDEIPRDGAHGKMIAFVHPKSTGGVLVELAQTRQ
tara:strand:- start:1468 stop:1887 length:420 start_codon:yes stop_codon:yes gene_type:complete